MRFVGSLEGGAMSLAHRALEKVPEEVPLELLMGEVMNNPDALMKEAMPYGTLWLSVLLPGDSVLLFRTCSSS